MSNTHTNRATETSKNSERVSRKPKRVPMSGQRLKMSLEEADLDPNFHYAWINDQKGLLYSAKRAGYEHVTLAEVPVWGERSIDSANPTESFVSMPVGHEKNGNVIIAYLMKQPMEYYEEDQAAHAALVNDREAELKRSLNSNEDGRYGSVEIQKPR